MWEFPGGKVEPGESDIQAASRELLEELGVRVTGVGDVQYSVRDADSAFVIEFLRVEIEGEPRMIEHTALAWVEPGFLRRYRLAPSDRMYVDEVLLAEAEGGNGHLRRADDIGDERASPQRG